jgi:hypothetical protein
MLSIISRSLSFIVFRHSYKIKRMPYVKVVSVHGLVSAPKQFDQFQWNSVFKISVQSSWAIASFVKIGNVTSTLHEEQNQW